MAYSERSFPEEEIGFVAPSPRPSSSSLGYSNCSSPRISVSDSTNDFLRNQSSDKTVDKSENGYSERNFIEEELGFIAPSPRPSSSSLGYSNFSSHSISATDSNDDFLRTFYATSPIREHNSVSHNRQSESDEEEARTSSSFNRRSSGKNFGNRRTDTNAFEFMDVMGGLLQSFGSGRKRNGIRLDDCLKIFEILERKMWISFKSLWK